ncbi:hypothetical protein AAVH_21261 [Aphelenchoides avenae]|nr:hypothetical protein AAVH_21261 [Aphelenchus avenae]
MPRSVRHSAPEAPKCRAAQRDKSGHQHRDDDRGCATRHCCCWLQPCDSGSDDQLAALQPRGSDVMLRVKKPPHRRRGDSDSFFFKEQDGRTIVGRRLNDPYATMARPRGLRPSLEEFPGVTGRNCYTLTPKQSPKAQKPPTGAKNRAKKSNRSDTFPDGSPTYLHYHDGTYQDGTVEGSVRSADALLAGVLDATTSVHGSSRAGSSGGGRGGGPRGLVAVKLQRKNGAQLGLGIAAIGMTA